MRILWGEVGRRDRWAGHTGSCRPWWKPEKGVEGVVRSSGSNFKKALLVAGCRLDWGGGEKASRETS